MLSELVLDILADFSDETGEPLVSEDYVHRALERSLPVAGFDLGIDYSLDAELVVPAMPDSHCALWGLRAKVLICRLLRAQASSRLDFSSGDKRVNRSQEARQWADLESSLLAEIQTLLRRINPDVDESLLVLDVHPRRYTQHRRHHHGE